jgi:hypothetical protein
MSAVIVSQIHAIRARVFRRFSSLDDLMAITKALKEAAADADRVLAHRLEAQAEEGPWQRGDVK